MRVARGRGTIRLRGCHEILRIIVRNPETDRWEPVLRTQPLTVARDEALQGEGFPKFYVHTPDRREEIILFPSPNDGYDLRITYHEEPRTC